MNGQLEAAKTPDSVYGEDVKGALARLHLTLV
jgi:hypothetical protein